MSATPPGDSVELQPARTQDVYQLSEDIELDLRAYELRCRGRALKLERLPMDILVFLIEHRGELVTREQIGERIWGKSVFLDIDNSINGAIRKIRHVLKDDPRQPHFILTIPGRGYRFIVPAAETENRCTATQTLVPSGLELQPGTEPSAERAGRRWPIWLGIGAVVVLLWGGLQWSRTWFRPQPTGRRVILAVLPFKNLTGDPGQEYFSDGLTEEMSAQLGVLDTRHLGVIARTSAMHYKNSEAPLERIGMELGAEYVIEGSVRRAADRVRVTVQLIQVKDRTHLWAHEYDRELSDILALQSEISQEVADEIQLVLGENKRIEPAHLRASSPRNDEAYDLYLRGVYFWNKRTIEGFQQAITYFQQAVVKDPNYARAYAGIADSYSLLGGYSGVPQNEWMAKARAAAQRALQLDDNLPEAHTAMGLIVQNYDHDWATAEKEFRRAIELNPNYATAHHWYAEYLTWRGRFDEAFLEIERARQLDPLSLIIGADRGAMLYYSRQYDRSLEQFRAVLEMDPTFSRARMVFAVYVQKGMFDEARSVNTQLTLDSPWYWANSAYIEARARRHAAAEHAVRRLHELDERQAVDAGAFGLAYASTGRRDESIAWLQKALAQHSNVILALQVDPLFDSMRADSRFQDLVRKVGLAVDPHPLSTGAPSVRRPPERPFGSRSIALARSR
jgi:TolB-like protein/DNA-binding winged helix-turn-helix (wHTH) protein/lipoprotein NlpI